MQDKLSVDVIIFGGGIAGLWLLNILKQNGYQAILLEQSSLGYGQTIKSQGIIHGGTKFALGGKLTNATQAIANMPSLWRQSLAGYGQIDLTQVNILSPYHYLWSNGKLTTRLTSFFASKALKSKAKSLIKQDYPAIFQHKKFKGSVYQLDELVLDIPSVIEVLSKPYQSVIKKLNDAANINIQSDQANHINRITINQNNEQLTIEAKHYVLTAGSGNESLLKQIQLDQPQMQRRPLHMVMVKQQQLPTLFAHCIGTGTKPRLTITTHQTRDHESVWYLGGDIAEKGIEYDSTQQISQTKKELNTLLPWVNLDQAKWASFLVDRAEPKQTNLLRPDEAFTRSIGNMTIVWPTKLALAPQAAEKVMTSLSEQNIAPSHNEITIDNINKLEPAPISKPIWDTLFK